MQHRATQDQDVTFLLITNKAFDIRVVGDDSDPPRTDDVTPGDDRPQRFTRAAAAALS